jgi:hypothetical protein
MTGLTRLLLDIQPQEDLSPLSLPDGSYIIYWRFPGLGKRNGAAQSTCGDCHAVFHYRQRGLALCRFDNFETQLSLHEGKHHITDTKLKIFLEMLIKTTSQCSCFLFTTRYIFDIDEKRGRADSISTVE